MKLADTNLAPNVPFCCAGSVEMLRKVQQTHFIVHASVDSMILWC